MKRIISLAALLPLFAFAQQNGRDAFMQQQAYAEMQRVSGQVSALQGNLDNISGRLSRLEGRGSGDQALRAEVEALKASVADLRRQVANQRNEIVREVSALIAKMQQSKPAPPPRPQTVVVSGPTSTYTVQSGDTLSLVAQAFNTSVAKIRELNNLKSNNLRIGQKLIVPQAK